MDLDLSGARALIVDDDEANLQLLARTLSPLGMELALLPDSRLVADRFVEFAPDIVLVDHMPHLDGFQVLSLIRGWNLHDEFLPVLMLTADITPEAKRRALSLGVSDFLTQPLDIIEVALRVENLLRTRLLYQQLQLRSVSLEVAVEQRTHQLAEANRRMSDLMNSKDEFIASVSHELRTPLSVVVGLAAELRDSPASFSRDHAAELIEMIADQSSDVAYIVEDLLVAARSEIDAVTVLVERVDVTPSIERVISPLPLADRERISVSVPAGVAVAGDVIRVRQILRNLLLNACRHGGPAIEVTAVNDGSWLVLGVTDNGPGLPEAQWEQIFNSYHSAHSIEGQPASVGLGLTVSRRLARLMGGDIHYGHDGHRSLLQFRIPLWPNHSSAPRELAPVNAAL